MNTINWGIIATGNIASKFAGDLQLLSEHQAFFVGSRNKAKAEDFARKFSIANFGSYDDVIHHTSVDIIYIATPHDSHAQLAIKCMRAGKHILCEKPMAVNAAQAQQMIKVAREEQVFLMEGLWTRFNPTIQHVLRYINEGKIGSINYINADFTFDASKIKSPRIKDVNLAGGALLDVGIYPAFLAYLILGKPASILASSHFYSTGADSQTSFIFKYLDAMTIHMAGFLSNSDMIAHIGGTEGRIDIFPRWHAASEFKIVTTQGEEIIRNPTQGNGFMPEILECGKCIDNHKIESDLWTHQNSLDLISILDQIRNIVGLRYPFE